MPRIHLMFFDAGGGHRAAATALKAVIDGQDRGWDVRMVNLQELLDPLDVFRKLTGIRLEDIYNRLLAKGWTLGSAQLLVGMHAVIRAYHRPTVRLLESYWNENRPDMVVSVVPNFNRAMREGLARALPGTPYVTILTDFADYPPHFWIERQEQYFICGTSRAVEQARAMGHGPERVFRVSGMIVRPGFYEPLELHRGAERQRLGLHPERPTGLVLFGGQGSSAMLEVARRVGAANRDVQLIFVCGRNQRLAGALRDLPRSFPMHVEGFTTEVPRYMQISDFLIGKPGPGSIAEAMVMNLPVIVQRNAWTLPQERYNADWVREKGCGIVLRGFAEIVPAIDRMIDPAAFEPMKRAAAAIRNRAVFEIPEILASLLARGS